MSSWIQTYTGARIDPFNPDPDCIRIVDIAHALSQLCRFGGHTTHFYSVAQHSLLVSSFTCKHHLQGLMHDAAEAYLVDVPSPIKIHLPFYLQAEFKLMKAISDKFGFEWPMSVEVEFSDIKLLCTEATQLLPGGASKDWGFDRKSLVLDFKIIPLIPQEAERCFLSRFEELTR